MRLFARGDIDLFTRELFLVGSDGTSIFQVEYRHDGDLFCTTVDIRISPTPGVTPLITVSKVIDALYHDLGMGGVITPEALTPEQLELVEDAKARLAIHLAE